MEVRKDGILLINLLFRIVTLIGFVSDYESPVVPTKEGTLNWNNAVTERVVLILANGLRDDFLELESTPFLKEIANLYGSFAKARIDEMVTIEGSLRSLVTGSSPQGSIFPWNRPERYRTILDYSSCKCVVGQLPMKKPLDCHRPNRIQSEIFSTFREMGPNYESDCLFVLSFDFGGISGRDYVEKLRELDEEVRKTYENLNGSTWVLTSSRGWSVWNRTDGRVDVPVLTWGMGIRPTREVRTIRLTDIPVLVNTLLGRTFPPGCLGQVPTYLISADTDAKFHMILYNFQHLEKTIGYQEDEEFEFRDLNVMFDEENSMSLTISIENFMEMVREKRLNKMKRFAVAIMFSFAMWSGVFAVVLVREFFTVEAASFVIAVNVTIAAAVIVYLYPQIAHFAVMILPTPAMIPAFSNIVRSFYAEGHRMFFFSVIALVLCTIFNPIGNRATILALIIPVALWPIVSPGSNRTNRKILLSWFVSSLFLAALTSFDVVGRDPIFGWTILSGVIQVGLFHLIHRAFKRRIDRQGWIITLAVLSSTYHVYFCHMFGFSTSTCLVSWCLLLFALSLTFALRGTLLERHLKLHLILLVPMQLLSVRHESIFHVALSIHSFSWIFIEHARVEKTVLSYNPSVFTLDSPPEPSSNNLHLKHYRQVFFFLVLSYVSFFAVGNLPTVYTYDFTIVKPFCAHYPIFLISLKLAIPFASLFHSFLTLLYTQRKDPANFLILIIHYSDVVASCFLIYAFIATEVFTATASHYVILQIATSAITALYFLHKYACFYRKT